MGIFVNIVIANIWQVAVSLCYLSLNALLSCLLVAREWVQYGLERKTLRVSHPQGIQRSTFFISMPLRYGVPMMVIFAVEHWLLSQTMFIIRVVMIDTTSVVDSATMTSGWTISGYSLLPAIIGKSLKPVIILILITFLAIALPLLGLSIMVTTALSWKRQKFLSMPFVSTCSASISSNCHPPIDDKDAHLLPVQWGVIEPDSEGPQSCSFTTFRDVQPPIVGHEYLGIPEKELKHARS